MNRSAVVGSVLALAALAACGSTETVDGLSREVDPPNETPSGNSGSTTDVRTMRGHFTYLADAGMFSDCATGRKYPVAMEADFIGLERAYLETVSEAGRPLLVSFEGSVVERQAMEGNEMEAAVVVNRFEAVHPGENCAPSKPDARLENTHWVVTEVGSTEVAVGAGDREAYLFFESGTNSVRGYAGCNQFTGRFETEGSELKFGALAATKRYCADTMSLEDSILKALGSVASYEITGDTLTLVGPNGEAIRFEARSFQ
jgi:copper homeostasis protein (lipoprotein)